MKILVPVKTGRRLQRQDSRQAGRLGHRSRQRQDVDEPVRRDRRRGGGPPQGKGRRRPRSSSSPIGPAKAQETIRTALAIGADRGILVETPDDATIEPLAVAKLLKAHRRGRKARPRHPRQAGDRRRLQPDRPDARRAARLAAGHVRLQARASTTASAVVTREVDGGLETVKLKLPAVVTTDLRLNEPRYPSLPNIMKAKKKPLDIKKPDDFGVDIDAAPQGAEDVRARRPQGRRQGRQRRRAGRQAQRPRRGCSDGRSASRRSHQRRAATPRPARPLTAAKALGGDIHVLVAGHNCQGRRRSGRQARRRRQGARRRRAASRATARRGDRGADRAR